MRGPGADQRMPLRNRRGAATLDYVLLLGAVLPLGGLCLYYGARVLRLAYDMICALVGWPFM